jgi:pyridoxal biosynthesis lyase PdxS
MANYALIKDGVVNNVIVADTKEIAEEVTGLTCVEYTDENPAGIGWSYDGAEFTAPVVVTEIVDEETPSE